MKDIYSLQNRISICMSRSGWLKSHKVLLTCLTGDNSYYFNENNSPVSTIFIC